MTYVPPGGSGSLYSNGSPSGNASQPPNSQPIPGGSVGGSRLPTPQAGNINGISLYGTGRTGPGGATGPTYGGGVSAPYSGGYNPSQDQWTQVTQLSPEQQGLYNTSVGNQQRAGDAASRIQLPSGQIDLNSLPRGVASVPTSQFQTADLSGVSALPANLDADRQRVQDSLYASQTQYLDPQFAQDQKALDSRLVNQGFRSGDEGWNTEQGNLGLQKQAAYANARDQAITGATSQQAQQLASALATRQQQTQTAFDLANQANTNATSLYGEQASNAALSNSARQQALQEQVTSQQFPLQQFLSLYGAGQGQAPNAGQTPGAQTPQAPDLLGATNSGYQGAINSFNAGQAQDAQTTGTVTSLAAIAALYF